MKITGLIWLERVVRKLEEKHGVRPDEVKEVLEGQPQFRLVEKGEVAGENLHAALGQTGGRRYLTVFFIYKRTREALIVTARDMAKKERRYYAKRKR